MKDIEVGCEAGSFEVPSGIVTELLAYYFNLGLLPDNRMSSGMGCVLYLMLAGF